MGDGETVTTEAPAVETTISGGDQKEGDAQKEGEKCNLFGELNSIDGYCGGLNCAKGLYCSDGCETGVCNKIFRPCGTCKKIKTTENIETTESEINPTTIRYNPGSSPGNNPDYPNNGDPSDADLDEAECVDANKNAELCKRMKERGCKRMNIAKKHCRKSCDMCDERVVSRNTQGQACNEKEIDIIRKLKKQEDQRFIKKCVNEIFKIEECVTNAVVEDYETSRECASCVGKNSQCTFMNCMVDCTFKGAKECKACYEQKCWSEFKTCTGMSASEPIPEGLLEAFKVVQIGG